MPIYKSTIHACPCGKTLKFVSSDFPEEWAANLEDCEITVVRVTAEKIACPNCGGIYTTGALELWDGDHSNSGQWINDLEKRENRPEEPGGEQPF